MVSIVSVSVSMVSVITGSVMLSISKGIMVSSDSPVIIEKSVPLEATSFATNQSHIGTISADLKMIETVWTTKGYSRFQGKLQLIRK